MGNPLLRKVASTIAIERIASANFQTSIADLVETMRSEKGVGIAAPQVGLSERVFCMEVHENARYPDKEPFSLCIVINPKIEFLSEEKIDSWEGCLSIPGIRGCLKRYKHIKLTGFNRHGHPFEAELKDFAAIIAQHELDHLNGILFIDRLISMETLSFQEEYEKYWNV
jgi:peptide deformylase